MAYVVTFLEGALTFISPCLLPMLPIYFAYLGGSPRGGGNAGTVVNACGFSLGFSAVFISMGAAAATFGAFIRAHTNALNIAGGAFVILLGLHYAGALRLPFMNVTKQLDAGVKVTGFFTAMLFGAVFSLGWTPCVGAFLGSALALAATAGGWRRGVGLLAAYSLGLAVPFVLSACLFQKLGGALAVIKKHYRVINVACGLFLVVLGALIAAGRLSAATGAVIRIFG